MLKLTTDKHETSRGLSATAELLVLLLVTAASDLLVHKNSIKFCSDVSYCLGRCPTKRPPGQTPLGHNPLVFCRSWVGWGQNPASWVE